MTDFPAIFRQPLPWLLLGVFLALLLLEAVRPLRRRKRLRGPRWLINLFFTAAVLAVGRYAVRPAALAAAVWAAEAPFGMLHLLPLPFWAQFLLGFFLMDLTFYYWHRVNHTWPLLWRFHNVHHLDPDLDVSTSFRFHPGEILYSTAFRVVQVGLVGLSPLTYAAYEVVFQLATMFHHSNLNLPLKWERRLNRALVTPRMHGVHHSAVGPETNSNYAVIFSWWDRWHRSLRLNVPQGEIVIGVPGYLLPRDNRFLFLLTLPFVKPRPYWRWPSGKAARRRPAPAVADPVVMLE